MTVRRTTTKVKRVIKRITKGDLEQLDPKAIAQYDKELPEPVVGSQFQRRGFVECISNDGFEDKLTIGVIYRIEELGEDEATLLINGDNGNAKYYPGIMFKSIDHGPFKVQDEVEILGIIGATFKKAPSGATVDNLAGYMHAGVAIMEVSGDKALVKIGSSYEVWFPNENLKFRKRHIMLARNPFKPGDKVRCIKPYARINVGEMYTINHAADDSVILLEDTDHRYRHTYFVKYEKLSRKEIFRKKLESRMTLSDKVRTYINKTSSMDTKLTPVKLRNAMINDNVIDDKVALVEINKIYKQIFSW